MKTRPIFYDRLSKAGKKHYDAMEELRPYSDEVITLMNMKEFPDVDEFTHNSDQIIFLGETDLMLLEELFPGEAEYYMNVLSD